MNYKRRRKMDVSHGSGNATQLMSLSLFIMLLAFFIVLNAISSYEDKKKEVVMQSVDVTFSLDVRDRDISPSIADAPEKSVHHGHVFDRLDALFDAQISSYKPTIDIGKGVMTVVMPVEGFSKAMMAVGQKDLLQLSPRTPPRGKFFLPTLASLLQSEINGQKTSMEIIMHASDNPGHVQNNKPKELSAIASRLTGFSNRMDALGFPQQQLNIGVHKGNKKNVTLVFRRYQPFSFQKDG